MAARKKKPKIQARDIVVSRAVEDVLRDLAEQVRVNDARCMNRMPPAAERSERFDERSARAEERSARAQEEAAVALKTIGCGSFGT